MQILNKQDFFKKAAYKTKLVELKDRDFSVLIRELTQNEIETVGLGIKGNDENLRGKQAQVVLWCAVDDEMEQIFNKGDLARLDKMGASIITQLSNEIFKISGVGEEPKN